MSILHTWISAKYTLSSRGTDFRFWCIKDRVINVGSPVCLVHSSCLPTSDGVGNKWVTVLWVMVYIRKCVSSEFKHKRYVWNVEISLFGYYFAKKFNHIIATELASRAANKLMANGEAAVRPWPRRFTTFFLGSYRSLNGYREYRGREGSKQGSKSWFTTKAAPGHDP